MKVIAAHQGILQTLSIESPTGFAQKGFLTELPAFDSLLPNHGIAYGAVHELLTHPRAGPPLRIAAMLAQAACRETGTIIWSDPQKQLYPPALADAGIPLNRLIVLRQRDPQKELWAIAECMRCKAIRATIAPISRLTPVHARQLQLAAERGGGIGILLRPLSKESTIYAAATRWIISPAPGDQTTQRWKMELIHAHGGKVGKSVLLEVSRQNYSPHDPQTPSMRAIPFQEPPANQPAANQPPPPREFAYA